MSDVNKAVFISYAREDADAAKRIGEALRSFGVEVWFDQNELRGGDAWDAKLRAQIRACTLFIPIITAATQERTEGYFRREWKLAVERTHDMAAGTPFLVPLAIDDTAEAEAIVPEEFVRVQWTRLPGGLPTPQFIEQVKRLLDQAAATLMASRPGTRSGLALPPVKRARARWPWVALGAVILGGMVVFFAPRQPRPATHAPESAGGVQPRAAVSALAKADNKSIAVLPFENLSPDADNAFFCDGMHEDVITALAKIHDLKVISRTSVMTFKTGDRNLKKIAGELGVANVLEGSVRRSGNKVRMTAQLIDARTDVHLWAETYTVDLTDVFTVQSELAAAITTALKATLSPQEMSLIARRPTENQEAYDLFLRGRNLMSAGSLKDLDQVIAFYEQAIAKDPTFVLAYALLSRAHGLAYWEGTLDPTPERREWARVAAETAMRLAPDLPQARGALGWYYYRCLRDWARARAEFRAAVAGSPTTQVCSWAWRSSNDGSASGRRR